jgi:hypothetical protein
MASDKIKILSDAENNYSSTVDVTKPDPIKQDESHIWWWKRSNRLVIIEPVLLFYTAACYPADTLHSQYFYIAVGKSMGIDVNNLTSASVNGSEPCEGKPNDSAYHLRESAQAASAHYSLYIDLALFIPPWHYF